MEPLNMVSFAVKNSSNTAPQLQQEDDQTFKHKKQLLVSSLILLYSHVQFSVIIHWLSKTNTGKPLYTDTRHNDKYVIITTECHETFA